MSEAVIVETRPFSSWKKTTIPTFVVTFWLDSDKPPGCRFPGDGTYTAESILLRSRSAHRTTPAKAYIPHHLLLICLSVFIVVVLFFFLVVLSLSLPLPCIQVKDVDTIPNASQVGFDSAALYTYMSVLECFFYFFFFFGFASSASSTSSSSFLCFYFFFQIFFGRAHNTFIYSLIITHANSAGSCKMRIGYQ